jgi:hypothetical protein
MLVCDAHALNGGLFIFSDCYCAAMPCALAEVSHMIASETS